VANISTDLARVAQSEIEQVRATHLLFQQCMHSAWVCIWDGDRAYQ